MLYIFKRAYYVFVRVSRVDAHDWSSEQRHEWYRDSEHNRLQNKNRFSIMTTLNNMLWHTG